MKKRTKVLIGVGVALLFGVAVVVGLLSRPQVPFQFLKGGEYQGTSTWAAMGGKTTAKQMYVLDLPLAQVREEAEAELGLSKGWMHHDGYGFIAKRGIYDYVECSPGKGGSTVVFVERVASVRDYIHEWLWNQTHN